MLVFTAQQRTCFQFSPELFSSRWIWLNLCDASLMFMLSVVRMKDTRYLSSNRDE